MPLKKKRLSGDLSNDSVDVSIPENEELSGDEDWLESLAVDAQQIKKYTNSQVSNVSLILIGIIILCTNVKTLFKLL